MVTFSPQSFRKNHGVKAPLAIDVTAIVRGQAGGNHGVVGQQGNKNAGPGIDAQVHDLARKAGENESIGSVSPAGTGVCPAT